MLTKTLPQLLDEYVDGQITQEQLLEATAELEWAVWTSEDEDNGWWANSNNSDTVDRYFFEGKISNELRKQILA